MSEKDGAAMIAAERLRQVSVEGWTPEHDDSHEGGELALVAACYSAAAVYQRIYLKDDHGDTVVFRDPWPSDWDDKRTKNPGLQSRVKMLVKAGALIAAEIDRLHRERELAKVFTEAK